MMKRIAMVMVVVALTASSWAQFHGVPAGATSLSNTHSLANPPGVPAGATSLGPQGFTPVRSTPFVLPANVNGRRNGQHARRIIIPVAVPLYSYGVYPYLSPAYGDPEMTPADYTDAPVPVSSLSPPQIVVAPVQQPPQVIVIDNRGTHVANDEERQQALATTNAAKSQQVAAKTESTPQPEDVGPMTVLVFRDGSRKEIKNYAIMGKELIVFGTGTMKRFQIAELDVPATMKENDVRGLDFRLP